jgi:hypothetical protein
MVRPAARIGRLSHGLPFHFHSACISGAVGKRQAMAWRVHLLESPDIPAAHVPVCRRTSRTDLPVGLYRLGLPPVNGTHRTEYPNSSTFLSMVSSSTSSPHARVFPPVPPREIRKVSFPVSRRFIMTGKTSSPFFRMKLNLLEMRSWWMLMCPSFVRKFDDVFAHW